jgi:hypothetical protein
MNELDEEEPSIEDIKKFADKKRNTIKKANPALEQKRLENLAKGRETRKRKLLEKKNMIKKNDNNDSDSDINFNDFKLFSDTDSDNKDNYDNVDKPFKGDLAGLYQYLKKKDERDKEKEQNIYDGINSIKEIITKPKSKPKPKPKPKPTGKTLDFVVSDKELEAVLNPPANNTNPIVDKKLQAFLEAFQKK